MPQKEVNKATQEKRNFNATIMSSSYRKLLTQNSMENLQTDFLFFFSIVEQQDRASIFMSLLSKETTASTKTYAANGGILVRSN